MARTVLPVQSNPAFQQSFAQPVDVTNGHRIDLSGPGIAALLDKYQLHIVVFNSAGSPQNLIFRAGYSPWATNYGLGDLTTSVTNGAVVDLIPDLTRHARTPDKSFDIDYGASFAGTILAVIGNAFSIPANLAQNAQIKSSPGWLLAAVCTATGTAGLTLYDNVLGSGTQLLAISSNPTVGTFYAGAVAKNAILSAGVANCPAVTAYWT